MEKRRDDAGTLWTSAETDEAIIRIVARLAHRDDVRKSTSFGPKGLNWDKLARLAVIKPIHKTLHERLDAALVAGHVSKVADLCDAVWALMEVVP